MKILKKVIDYSLHFSQFSLTMASVKWESLLFYITAWLQNFAYGFNFNVSIVRDDVHTQLGMPISTVLLRFFPHRPILLSASMRHPFVHKFKPISRQCPIFILLEIFKKLYRKPNDFGGYRNGRNGRNITLK